MDDDYPVIEPFNDAVGSSARPRHDIGYVHLEDSLKEISRLLSLGIAIDDMDFRGRPLKDSVLTPQLKKNQTISRSLIADGVKLRSQCHDVGDDFDGEVIGKKKYLVLFDPQSSQSLLSDKDGDVLNNDSRFKKPFMIFATPTIVMDDNNKIQSFAWKINNLDDVDASPDGVGIGIYHGLVKGIDKTKSPAPRNFAAE